MQSVAREGFDAMDANLGDVAGVAVIFHVGCAPQERNDLGLDLLSNRMRIEDGHIASTHPFNKAEQTIYSSCPCRQVLPGETTTQTNLDARVVRAP
jgi:hypothetical protein